MQHARDDEWTGAGDHPPADEPLVIDCGCCAMQGTTACDDCVVTFLLSDGSQPVELSRAESSALDALAEQGLVPRLRLIAREHGT